MLILEATEMNEKLVRVVFYVVDNFKNPRFYRKHSIGYLAESHYLAAKEAGKPVFELTEDDWYAEKYPETMTA